MDGRPTISLGMRISGPLYAFIHKTTRRSFLGASLSGWIRFLSIALVVWALFSGWPFLQILALALVAVLIRYVYWQARRAGYVRFIPLGQNSPGAGEIIADEEKITVEATGTFSVTRREEYVLLRPANYWRAPNGDHAIMVEHRPGRFLYQFIQPGSLQSVQPGYLCYGSRPRQSLALTFLSGWGPQDDIGPLTMYSPGPNGSAAKLERTAYLSFDDREALETVWRNLLRDSNKQVTRPV